MAPLTFREILANVHVAAANMGMDLSPRDMAFIVSEFLRGMVASMNATPPSLPPGVEELLRSVADDLDNIRDE